MEKFVDFKIIYYLTEVYICFELEYTVQYISKIYSKYFTFIGLVLTYKMILILKRAF